LRWTAYITVLAGYRERDHQVDVTVGRVGGRRESCPAADIAPVPDPYLEHSARTVRQHRVVDQHVKLLALHLDAGDDRAQHVSELAEALLPALRLARGVGACSCMDGVHHDAPLVVDQDIDLIRAPAGDDPRGAG